MTQGAEPVGSGVSPSWIRIAATIALAVAVGVGVWLVLKDRGDSKPAGVTSTATAATLETVRALPAEMGHAVYWAGPRATDKYELTEVDGRIFIRYLPFGVHVGDPRPNFLTVGTYRVARPYLVLKRQARRPGNVSRDTAGGGIAVWSKGRPQSVYLAHPGSAVQVEVYDPSATRARRLATSGAIRAIR